MSPIPYEEQVQSKLRPDLRKSFRKPTLKAQGSKVGVQGLRFFGGS